MTRIAIDPLTRIEGHGKVTIQLDADGLVTQTRFHAIEFRGFERFIQGRLYWDAPAIVQHLCGICPVSHHLAAAKAVDAIAGVDVLTPTAEKVRRLMHYAQVLQSHALHFFHLASPDLLFGFDAAVAQRSIAGIAADYPHIARSAIAIRKYGQTVIEVLGGKKVHPSLAVPGGVNRNLPPAERDALRAGIDPLVTSTLDALDLCKRLIRTDEHGLGNLGAIASNYLSLVRADGAMDLYDGGLRAIDAEGRIIFDRVPPDAYRDVLSEDVRRWSYMKFPYIRALGSEAGWYRVGPLAQINCCDFIDTPLAERERREFKAAAPGRPVHATLLQHWARMICMVHAAEKVRDLLDDPDLQGNDLVRALGKRRATATACLEAPRGTLFHHYDVGPDDLIEHAHLIVSTTSNNEAINRSIHAVALDRLSGHEITDVLLNLIEVAIRAYDPCLSCATHALGDMPLIVTIEASDGTTIARRVRD